MWLQTAKYRGTQAAYPELVDEDTDENEHTRAPDPSAAVHHRRPCFGRALGNEFVEFDDELKQTLCVARHTVVRPAIILI